jgi:uncharacterized protein (DUF1919 family)
MHNSDSSADTRLAQDFIMIVCTLTTAFSMKVPHFELHLQPKKFPRQQQHLSYYLGLPLHTDRISEAHFTRHVVMGA